MPNPELDGSELDAYQTAKPGEPTFTLQGGDPLAPELVLAWALGARMWALSLDESDPLWEELLLRATSAEEVAWTMLEYQDGFAAEETVTQGSGELSVKAQMDFVATRRKTEEVISNLLATSLEWVERLQEFDIPAELHSDFARAFVLVEHAADELKEAAAVFHVRRAGELD